MADTTIVVRPQSPRTVVVRPQTPRTVVVRPERGPKGDPGSGAPEVHVQATAAATWIITHTLGHYPQVTVVDDAGAVILADVFYTALDSITVVHAAPRTGAAYIM
jgi:hypothetical protein